jgi:hypothetical protein
MDSDPTGDPTDFGFAATSASGFFIGTSDNSGWGNTIASSPIFGPGPFAPHHPFAPHPSSPKIYGPISGKKKAEDEWLVTKQPDMLRTLLECGRCGGKIMISERAIEEAKFDLIAEHKRRHRCEDTPRAGYKCEGCGKAAFYFKHKVHPKPGDAIRAEDCWCEEGKAAPKNGRPIDCQFCGENIIIPKTERIKVFDPRSGEETR